ncbi:het domain protein, partial [Moniliophthora roreri]
MYHLAGLPESLASGYVQASRISRRGTIADSFRFTSLMVPFTPPLYPSHLPEPYSHLNSTMERLGAVISCKVQPRSIHVVSSSSVTSRLMPPGSTRQILQFRYTPYIRVICQ